MKLLNLSRLAYFLAVLSVLVFSPAIHAQQALGIPDQVDPEMVKDAGNKAISLLLNDMLSRTDLPKRFAVLPIQKDIDSDYFTLQFRNEFTTLGGQNGYELFTRMDDEWKNLLNEIKWGQEFGDTMDPSTVQKFGRIQGVQGIITGRVVSITQGDKGEVRVRFIAQAFEVETGRLLWGEEKVGTADLPPPPPAAPPAPEPFHWKRMAALVGGAFFILCVLLLLSNIVKNASRPR